MEFYSMERYEIEADAWEEYREWLDFENDLATAWPWEH